MAITYRNYQDISDLDLQTKIWIEATKTLPWAWKPNNTQKLYLNQSNFDLNSKLFAVEDNYNSIGYISCIKRDDFIPFGSPWVLKGYEGEIQHHLFDSVYEHCVKVFKSKSFLQRFRKEWDYQISFFEEKGFVLDQSHPIFLFDLKDKLNSDLVSNTNLKLKQSLPVKSFLKIITNDDNYKKIEDRGFDGYINYYRDDLDVDWFLEVRTNSGPVAMSMVTIRADTKYAEIVGLFSNSKNSSHIEIALQATLEQLKKNHIEHASMTVERESPKINLLKTTGFKLKSQSVFYLKKI